MDPDRSSYPECFPLSTTMGSTKHSLRPSWSANSVGQSTLSARETVRRGSCIVYCTCLFPPSILKLTVKLKLLTVGQIGLLERENASILNASILTFAQRTIRGFQKAMHALKLACPLFLTQNDGTLTTAASAARLPIRTFASGPTNSMRGAAFLSGLDDAEHRERKSTIVVDIGGTTTDVGVLLPSGFPRQAASYIEVGGVRTNFSMADVQSIGLGGGSVVRVAHSVKGTARVDVGPESVGHNLTRDARVFGGNVLTATDIVVASGRAELGEKDKVTEIAEETVALGLRRIKKLLEGIIDKCVRDALRHTTYSRCLLQDEDVSGRYHGAPCWRRKHHRPRRPRRSERAHSPAILQRGECGWRCNGER